MWSICQNRTQHIPYLVTNNDNFEISALMLNKFAVLLKKKFKQIFIQNLITKYRIDVQITASYKTTNNLRYCWQQ